jgi:hypothetical protein
MAEHREIIAEVEALTVHCRPPVMAIEQRARWQVDWARDLEKYPIEIIQQAFRQWRQGESGKFPTPGQILPMLDRMTRRPDGPSQAQSLEWRYDLSEEAYRALSLNEKIRHHRIAAGHCRRKAGPMPHKVTVAKKDMPAEWQEWRARAERHDDEAKRLQQSIGHWDARA